MKQQNKALHFSTWSNISIAILIMISLSTAVIVSPNDLMADSSNGKKNGTQKLGKQMGSFMNSFMDGLDDQQSAKPAGEIKPKGLAQKKSLNSRRNSYDPWGPRTDRYNKAYRYDPWGATKDNRDLTRFADQDWALQKRYYRDGVEPLRNQRGYRSYPDPYYGRGYQNQNRYYERSWPGSSYPDPYDRNRYNGSGWRR